MDNIGSHAAPVIAHLEQHAIRRNLRHVMFEIRNDEITTAAAQREWGLRLNRALTESRFLPQP